MTRRATQILDNSGTRLAFAGTRTRAKLGDDTDGELAHVQLTAPNYAVTV